jgi:nucleoside-diphosphate-sugar epimerase
MTEIIETVANLLSVDFNMKVSKRTIQLPWVIGQLAQFIDGFLQSLGFYHQKIHVLSEMNKTIACNIAKAKRELGYQPRVDLKEGMRRSIKWVLESGHTI